MKPPSRAHGTHGSGGRDYDKTDADAVVRVLHGADGYLTVDAIALASGVAGRTVRSILSALDGGAFVLAEGDDGCKIATSADETESMTRRLESQAAKMLARARRRRDAIARLGLPRTQGSLF